MNIFKAVLFAGMVLASQATAQTFVRFHSGVNLSVAPGGSDRSAAPLDVQEATNAQRVAEAADIGFDLIRLRVSLAPWTDTGSTADEQRADARERDHPTSARLWHAGRCGDDGRFTLDDDSRRLDLHCQSLRGRRLDSGMASGTRSPSRYLPCCLRALERAAKLRRRDHGMGCRPALTLSPGPHASSRDQVRGLWPPLGRQRWNGLHLARPHPVPWRHKCPVYIPPPRPIRVYRARPLVAARWALPLFDWFDVALRYC